MSTRHDEEARAKCYLTDRGYRAAPPNFLPTGKGKRKPEFWATSPTSEPHEVWVEVKSGEEAATTTAVHQFLHVLRSIEISPELRGHATLDITPGADLHSVQRVVKHFSKKVAQFKNRRINLGITQQIPDRKDFCRVEIEGEVPELIWAFGAGRGKLHPPDGFCDEGMAIAPAKCVRSDGTEQLGQAFNFLEWTGSRVCALAVRLDPKAPQLTSIGPMAGGRPNVREWVADDLKDANQQIKSACSHRTAPGIVIIVPRDVFADDAAIAHACYGDEIWEVGTGVKANLGNGVFGEEKNTHISAVVRLWPSGVATYFPNRYALQKVADHDDILRGTTKYGT